MTDDDAFNLDGDLDYLVYSPICTLCQHFTGTGPGRRTCKAFPDGIPPEIWRGENPHTEPYEGDQGVQYQRIPAGQVEAEEEVEKALTIGDKIYLQPGEKPPKGVQAQHGPRGGSYYLISDLPEGQRPEQEGPVPVQQTRRPQADPGEPIRRQASDISVAGFPPSIQNRNDLTEEERGAVVKYRGIDGDGWNYPLNHILRNSLTTDEAIQKYLDEATPFFHFESREKALPQSADQVRETVARLDRTIQKSELTEDCAVWRGVDLKKVLALNGVESLDVGDEIADAGYMSTSPDADEVGAFTEECQIPNDIGLTTAAGKKPPQISVRGVFRIALKKGDHGVYSDAETELILPRRMKFKVTKIGEYTEDHPPAGRRRIWADLLRVYHLEPIREERHD